MSFNALFLMKLNDKEKFKFCRVLDLILYLKRKRSKPSMGVIFYQNNFCKHFFSLRKAPKFYHLLRKICNLIAVLKLAVGLAAKVETFRY